MRIYLASTAPHNETWRKEGMLPISNRLLSYYHIRTKQLQSDEVFHAIKKLNQGEENHENQQNGATSRIGESEAGIGQQGAD